MFDRNIHRGRRLTAAHAYLRPAMRTAELDVVSRALATRVLFDGLARVGVEYRRARTRTSARVR